MRGIATRTAPKAVALAAIFAFALCACIAVGSQKAYAGWDSAHEHYWDGETMVCGVFYVPEDEAYYYFDDFGIVGKGWCWFDWEGDDAYRYADPTTGKLKFGWQKIGGYWYYFAPTEGSSEDYTYYYELGVMYEHGVSKIKGKWYYLATPDDPKKWGKMQYKWIKEKNGSDETVWYYGDPNNDSQLAKGWKKIGGKWYYFEPNEDSTYMDGRWYEYGVMHWGRIETINGHKYSFAKNGALQSGWIKDSYRSATWEDGSYQAYTDWYYADPNNDCRLATGWKKIGGYWYYFDSKYGDEMNDNGTWTINGKLYIFDKSGKLPNKEGWVSLSEEYFYEDGSESQVVPYWAYANSSGIATVGWKKISGYWYHFSETGFMDHDTWAVDSRGACYLKSNGKMAASEWVRFGGNWYYVDASGHRVTGYHTIDGEVYYFNAEGVLIK